MTSTPRRAEVAAGYDRGVEAYDALWSPVILPPAIAVVNALGLGCHSRVVDVGAGTGALLESLQSAAPAVQVVALDASAEMLRIAQRRGAAAVRGDALDLPFADRTTDAVLLAYVLFHLADPRQGLAEAARVLRTQGRVGAVTWAWTRSPRAAAVWDEVLADAGVPPAPPRQVDADLDRPDAVDTLLRSVGFLPTRVWLQPLRRQWDRSSFWQLATGSGVNRSRLAVLNTARRSELLARILDRIDGLQPQDFLWEGEVVCAVAQKAHDTG